MFDYYLGVAEQVPFNYVTLAEYLSNYPTITIKPDSNEHGFVKVGMANNGRVFEMPGDKAVTSINTNKFGKHIFVPVHKKSVKFGIKERLALLVGISAKFWAKENDLTMLLNITQYLDPDTGLLDYDELMELAKQELVEVKPDKESGWEEVIEVQSMIRAFNDPEKYATYAVISIDAKSQNNTILWALLLKDRQGANNANFFIDAYKKGLPAEILKQNDPNKLIMKKAKIYFKRLVKDNILSQSEYELLVSSRDFFKYSNMVLLYGGGLDTIFVKAIKSMDSDKQDMMKIITDKIKDYFEDFLDFAVPGLKTYFQLFRKLAKVHPTTIYRFNILGRSLVAADLSKFTDIVEVEGLKRTYTFYNSTYITTEEFNRRMQDITDNTMSKLEELYQSGELSMEEYRQLKYQFKRTKNLYENFKASYTVHMLDGTIATYVATVAYDFYDYTVRTNHDSFTFNPMFLFETIEIYLDAVKLLSIEYDGYLIIYLLTIWGATENDIIDLFKNKDPESILGTYDLANLPYEYMHKSILG